MSTHTLPSLRDMVEDGRVHVFDGAMGTLLYNRGVFVNVCYDELSLEQPDLVKRIHSEYVSAGAEILETNTFGANPVKLSGHGLEERTEEINREAARLVVQAADGRARVVGAVGPLGIRLEPWGPTAVDEAEAYFRRQVTGLLEGGVDGILLETFGDIHEIRAAYRAARALTDLPVIAQMTVDQDGATAYGTQVEQLAGELDELGAEVVGLNCSVGPSIILDAVEELAPRTRRALSAQPNAGLPRTVRDRKIYMASPEYMAQYARRLIDAGVRFVGGCCGTTPDHVRHIAETVRSLQPRHPAVRVRSAEPGDEGSVAVEPVPLERRSVFGAALARGDFLRTVELLPPEGWDAAGLIQTARRARDMGVHAVNVLDSPRGRSRMGVISAGLLVQQQAGIEAVVHYTCRDRNMMGMVSDLLGAAGGGIRNVLLVSGDPPVQGPYPDSTAVFDIDSIGLTNVVHGLNRGVDPGGNPVGAPARFVIGVAVDQGAVDMEREVERLMWKVDAGADFAVTQPVFDAGALGDFLERTAEWPVPVLAGVRPLTSLRNAEFMANEVPGVVVPDSVVERMRRAQDSGPEAAAREGVDIALEMVEAVRPLIRGGPREHGVGRRGARAEGAGGPPGDRITGLVSTRPPAEGRSDPPDRPHGEPRGGVGGSERADAGTPHLEGEPPAVPSPSPPLLEELRDDTPRITVELRPPRSDLDRSSSMDTWIDMFHTVRKLGRRGHTVFLTDNAVGAAEEENLAHLGANLSGEAEPERLVPFLTCKHPLDYCLMYAERAWSQGFRALTVLGGDRHVGPPRCVPHAYLLRQEIRVRVPGLALGGWANPHADAAEQAGYLAAPEATAEFFLTQVVSHHSADRVEALVGEVERQGVGMPGVFGVFYYRSANPETLERLGDFFPVPAEELTREFDAGATAEEICARSIRTLREAGGRHVYVSNLGVRNAATTLAKIAELV